MSALCHLSSTPRKRQLAGRIGARLHDLGLDLPEPSTPGANYVPYVRQGELLFLTGQISQWNGQRRYIGKLGRDFGIEDGRRAARICALNLFAHMHAALDCDLDRVERCVRIAGFVNSIPEFTGQSQVIDGASDLFVAVFGDAGRHSRLAVGVSALPYDVAVEVEAVVAVR